MSSIPGNTTTTATIAQGQIVNGELTTSGDSDWYRATFSSGLSYGFRVSGDGSGTSLPDPDLYLYDATGNRIAGSTNYSNSSTSLNYSAATGGTFYVGVSDTIDLGKYVLTWLGNDTIRRDISTTATLSQGGTVSSAIDVSGDSDWFKVSLKAGLDYGFAVSGDGTTTSLPDPDIHLRDANGTRIVTNTNYSNSSTSIAHAASQSGTYFVEVTDTVDTGNYKLTWLGNDTILRNTATTAVLGQGKTIASSIDVRGDADWFKVTLQAGISYAFKVAGTGASKLPDGDIHLRDSNGNVIAGETNYSSPVGLVTFTAKNSGTYFVSVTDSSDIGGYVISNNGFDTVVNNAGTDRSLAVGTSLTGQIDVERDSDWYAFSVKSGVTYQFSASGTGSAGADGILLNLRDANGNRIAYDSDSKALIEFKATSSGTVYLDVAGQYSTTTGKFVLSAVSDQSVLKGTSGADVLTGGSTKTTIYGYAGNDHLKGGAGNDILIGGKGGDRLDGGAGKDTASYQDATKGITASLAKASSNKGDAKGDVYVSIENLTGSRYADKLTGDGKANVLTGGAGKDVLTGGKGADDLYGGKGADTFVFKSVSELSKSKGKTDTIFDFSRKEKDHIDFSGIDANTGKKGNQAFDFVGTDKFSKTDGELRYVKEKKDTYIYGDVNGDGKADFVLHLDSLVSLKAGDFIL
ncbi:calcium-binding protein [Rhizobium sp. GN54]|uniref:calcium-binding protein n=1 Tax=Rhizobium sp. GN54 TaxID=2898150 RepID=UPI001E35EAA6|nr:pre-peptidase C-terminal domain-containing protein [Rhizobium sp. GN54]MCD2183220.1 pre-peptidase C-terminal domain-containing protein [Rhizobium sp. GN54]